MPGDLIAVRSDPRLMSVTMHGHVACAPAQIEVVNSALNNIGKKHLTKKLLGFDWLVPSDQRYGHLQLAVSTEKDDGRDLIILTVAMSRTRRHSKALLNPERHSQVQTLLDAFVNQSLTASFTCSMFWHYRPDEKEPVMRLPFELLVASTNDLRSVTGLRISNPDGTAWVALDQGPDRSTLHVIAGFTHDIAINSSMLNEAVQYGESLAAQVLSSGGDRSQ